jgi:hypothetical protein
MQQADGIIGVAILDEGIRAVELERVEADCFEQTLRSCANKVSPPFLCASGAVGLPARPGLPCQA